MKMKKTGKRIALLAAVMLLAANSFPVSSAGFENGFDAEYYASSYKDLRDAFGKDEKALYNHYQTYGISEGRNANPYFNVRAYRERYPDLDKAFGDNWAAYYRHYEQYGLKEGRSATVSGSVFDAKMYAEKNPDVYAVFGDDPAALFRHFLSFGYKEGREATAFVPGYGSQTSGEETEDVETGDVETGDVETGAGETGDVETGGGEAGDVETGDGETGDEETGDVETGDVETGDGETGDGETGDGETGDVETGDGETGDGETGDGETDTDQGEDTDPDTPDAPETSDIYIEPIANLSDDFIRGMDASSVLVEENSGVVYYNFDGEEQDVFQTMAEAGVNYIRLRVWNDPFDESGNGYGGGNNDVATAIALGQRATQYGMKVCIDFHYSDFWADPKRQHAPKAWKDMSVDEKCNALYDFTKESLTEILDSGVDVGMVQIGNEINNGMSGETEIPAVMSLLENGSRAVREIAASYGKEIQVAVHYTNIEDNEEVDERAAALAEYQIDYDVFGLSYYPFWDGTNENMQTVARMIQEKYGKKVMIAETSYCYTAEDGDGSGNSFLGTDDLVDGYGATVQSQATMIRDVCAAANDAGAIGVFYWEGTWIPVGEANADNSPIWEQYGSGWASSYASDYDPDDAGKYYGGCSWDNQALFDFHGYPLASLKVFQYMKSGAQAPLAVDYIPDVYYTCNVGSELKLPETVTVVYNNRACNRQSVVNWNEEQLAAIDTKAGGVYEIDGVTEEGEKVVCHAEVKLINLVANPGFEEIVSEHEAPDWTVTYTGDTNPTDFQVKADDAYSGETSFHFFAEAADAEFQIEQVVTGLEPGTYQLFAAIQGLDNSGDSEFELYAVLGDGTEMTADCALTGWAQWKQPTISKIQIAESNSTITIGMRIRCGQGSWGSVDDFTLNLLPEGMEEAPAGLVQNSGFEDADTSMWQITCEGETSGAWIGDGESNQKNGTKAFRYWSESDMDFRIEQEIANLEPGIYELSMWAQGGDNDENAVFELYAINSGGTEKKEAFVPDGWNSWKNPTVSEIEVTEGGLTIGVRVKCNAGGWGAMDDFTLTKVSEL